MSLVGVHSRLTSLSRIYPRLCVFSFVVLLKQRMGTRWVSGRQIYPQRHCNRAERNGYLYLRDYSQHNSRYLSTTCRRDCPRRAGRSPSNNWCHRFRRSTDTAGGGYNALGTSFYFTGTCRGSTHKGMISACVRSRNRFSLPMMEGSPLYQHLKRDSIHNWTINLIMHRFRP